MRKVPQAQRQTDAEGKDVSDKKRYPREDALRAAEEICDGMASVCEKVMICGSVRRRQETVGDVEIVFIPRIESRTRDLFEAMNADLADELINHLVRLGVLAKRFTKCGSFTWGHWNKRAIHAASGIPVDFFSTKPERWWLTVVIRTGPRDFNLRLIQTASRNRVKVHAYGQLEKMSTGAFIPCNSERDVFEACGLPWLEPQDRK